jgi:YebC/PmpR family DNA-binding regulatory protein
MGRIFETRKATMFARWDRMAKAFARCSKEIVIAVKAGGGSTPETNPALRRALQNARAVNMPKDKIESAIKRATGQGDETYEEILYEGYAPHGIAVLVETATDNPVRTVANMRMHFTKRGGNLGSAGGVSYLFQRMGVFRLDPTGLDVESLELDLIDYGLEEMGEGAGEQGEAQIVVRTAFNDFGAMQRALEERGVTIVSAKSEYIPTGPIELDEERAREVLALIDKLEQDDDVQHVYHNLA